jgi:hypothetical protein
MQQVLPDNFIMHGRNVTQTAMKQFYISEACSNNQQNLCLPMKVKITFKKH